MKKVLAACLLVFVSSSAFAAVPVARTDSFLEKLFLARYEEMQSWLENVAYSITNPKTLDDLIKLPDKLKNLSSSLKNLTDFGDVTGEITGELMKAGNNALGDMVKYINMKDIASGNFDRVASRVESAIKEIPIDASGVSGTTKDEALKSSASAVLETSRTVPMSVPAVSSATASKILTDSPSVTRRKQNVISTASGAKLNLMEQYASFIAKYDGDSSMHRKKIEQIMGETQKVLESSRDYAKTVGNMEVQQAIARVGADQIALMAMQNVLLANVNDTLADEIVLLSKIGLAETEEYAENIKKALDDYIDIYSGVKGK